MLEERKDGWGYRQSEVEEVDVLRTGAAAESGAPFGLKDRNARGMMFNRYYYVFCYTVYRGRSSGDI